MNCIAGISIGGIPVACIPLVSIPVWYKIALLVGSLIKLGGIVFARTPLR